MSQRLLYKARDKAPANALHEPTHPLLLYKRSPLRTRSSDDSGGHIDADQQTEVPEAAQTMPRLQNQRFGIARATISMRAPKIVPK